MSKNEFLNVINGKGKIIGIDSRENIHTKGLLHQEIHVWFFTPKGEIIFQHRSKKTDTYPNLLDATVGGHVEIDQNYEETALKEIAEETGIKLTKKQLIPIQIVHSTSHDPVTNKTNNVLRAIYAYCFKGNLNDLKLEKNKGLGFEAWPFEKVFKISEEDKKKIIPSLIKKPNIYILKKIKIILKT